MRNILQICTACETFCNFGLLEGLIVQNYFCFPLWWVRKLSSHPEGAPLKGTKCQNRTLDPLKCIEIIFMINQDQFKNGCDEIYTIGYLLFGLLQLSERWECDEIYTIGYYSGFYSSLKDENWANGAHFGFWSGFWYDCFTFILDYDQVSEWVYRFWTKMPKFQTLFFKYLLISLGPFSIERSY